MPRGGRREGSGRKAGSGEQRRILAVTLAPWAIEALDDIAGVYGVSRGRAFERVLRLVGEPRRRAALLRKLGRRAPEWIGPVGTRGTGSAGPRPILAPGEVPP